MHAEQYSQALSFARCSNAVRVVGQVGVAPGKGGGGGKMGPRQGGRGLHTAAETASLMAAVLHPPAIGFLPAMAPCPVPLLRASPGAS